MMKIVKNIQKLLPKKAGQPTVLETVCTVGSSKVWGEHHLKTFDGTAEGAKRQVRKDLHPHARDIKIVNIH